MIRKSLAQTWLYSLSSATLRIILELVSRFICAGSEIGQSDGAGLNPFWIEGANSSSNRSAPRSIEKRSSTLARATTNVCANRGHVLTTYPNCRLLLRRKVHKLLPHKL